MLNKRGIATVLLALALPACADEPPDPCAPRKPVDVDPAGQTRQYVVDSLDLPGDPMEVHALGFNLDEDPQDRPDNLLGSILSIFGAQGYDLDAEAQALIDAGKILHLVELRAVSLDDAEGVGLYVAHGVDMDGDPTDNFSGSEPFAINPALGDGFLSGRIEDRHLTVELGTVPIAVTFPGLDEPLVIELQGARLEADVTDGEMVGRIGGAVAAEAVDTELIPALHEGVVRVVARECEAGVCPAGSFGALLIEVFDDDKDGTITVEEMRQDEILASLLAPDVDMFDAQGEAAASCDGTKEGVSVGIGFHAVSATFP